MALGQRTNRGRGHSAKTPTSPATDRRILEHARLAFNERGVSAVGIREIARDLGLSPGNVSYHFPTKEALVTALVRDGHSANTAIVNPAAALRSFADVDAAIRGIMQRDADNQWLMRDYVGLVATMPAFRALHGELQGPREARIDVMVARLLAAALLDRDKIRRWGAELKRQIFTQIFFWLPSALVSFPGRNPATSIDAYARAAMALFIPHATPKGRRQLEGLLRRPSQR